MGSACGPPAAAETPHLVQECLLEGIIKIVFGRPFASRSLDKILLVLILKRNVLDHAPGILLSIADRVLCGAVALWDLVNNLNQLLWSLSV